MAHFNLNIGFTPVFRVVQNQGFYFEHNQLTNQDLLKQANHQLCQTSWKTLSTQYPDNNYMHIYCFASSYYYALMVNGYGIKQNQPIHYLPNKGAPDWTLGAILYPLHKMPH